MGVHDVRPLTELPALLAQLGAPDAFTSLGPLRDAPVVVVDTSSPDVVAATPAVLPANLPVVLIGIGTAVGPCDVVVDDEDGAARVIAAANANPHAATTLVQLLRLQAHLAPLDALAAESLAYATLQGGAEFAAWLAARGARVRRPDPTPRVRVEHRDDGATAVVTLDRPRLFNLYDAAMRDQLVDAASALVHDDTVRRVELRAAGRAFCGGGDPAEFGTTRDTALAHLIRSSANVAPLLVALAPKLHAHVHGAAVGAGCELAAFASHVSATEAATFSLPEVSMGLVPGAGGTVSVAARIGRHRAAWMALTGATVDAATALAWGLVDELL